MAKDENWVGFILHSLFCGVPITNYMQLVSLSLSVYLSASFSLSVSLSLSVCLSVCLRGWVLGLVLGLFGSKENDTCRLAISLLGILVKKETARGWPRERERKRQTDRLSFPYFCSPKFVSSIMISQTGLLLVYIPGNREAEFGFVRRQCNGVCVCVCVCVCFVIGSKGTHFDHCCLVHSCCFQNLSLSC